MKKLLLFLIIVFLAFAGDAQNFFEKIIPNEDGIMRQGQYVVETQDHGFIVACTAPYYYQNDLLLSVDEDGEITNSLVMQIGEKILKYCGVFKHPDYNDEYLAIAVLTNDSYNYIQNSIIFLRVDDKLNILNQDVWQLDEEYTQLAGWQCTDFPKFIVNDDGTLEMAAHFYRYDTHYGYLFAKLTPDGEPIKMQEDYEVKNNGNLLLDFFIKSKTDLSIAVAGYPEGHIESPDLETDLKYLKQKVETGADVIYTQLFFNNDKFYDFVEKVRELGITQPVIPGIMPIISAKQVKKMTSLARIEVPKSICEKLEKYSTADLKEFGIEYASKQCEGLIDFGVKGLHFFTLNRAYSTSKILDNIL